MQVRAPCETMETIPDPGIRARSAENHFQRADDEQRSENFSQKVGLNNTSGARIRAQIAAHQRHEKEQVESVKTSIREKPNQRPRIPRSKEAMQKI